MNDLPPFPANIGKSRRHTAIDGREVYMTIEDEIVRQQGVARNHKLIFFQKIRFEEDGRLEYRLTYYMLGVKPGPRRGRWVFGQYSLLIPAEDLKLILKEARKRRWPGI